MGRFGDDLTNVFPGFSQNGTLGSTGLGNLTTNCGTKVTFVNYAIRYLHLPTPTKLPSRTITFEEIFEKTINYLLKVI